MAWIVASPNELEERLESGPPVALILGAGVSMPAPSRLPAAGAWKAHLLGALAVRAGLGFDTDPILQEYLDQLSGLGRTTDLKLEAVLQAVEDRRSGLARELVRAAIDGAPPNVLHESAAGRLLLGSVRCVVTPNFDELVEAASGSRLTTWTTGDPPATAQVLHVHGRLGAPASLRHTLNRFGARLPLPEHELVANALRNDVVALGWSATDPDLLAALNEGDGVVHVLIQGTAPLPETAATLSALSGSRPVTVHPGGFAQLAPGLAFGAGRHLEAGASGTTATEDCMALLTVAEARSALAHLSFRYSLSNPPRHQRVLDAWSMSVGAESERGLFRLAKAEEAQARNHAGRAVVYNLGAWASTRDPGYLSASGDALERVGRGLNPFKRLLALPVHAAAVLQQHRRGRVDPWARARFGRALSGVGFHRLARRHIDEALRDANSTDSSLWVRGHLHRLRALESAYAGQPWSEDLEDALEAFRFDNRPLEMGSVHRAAAACRLITGGAGWREEAMSSLDRCEEFYRRASDGSAFPLLRTQRLITKLPRPVARILLRFA